jgi:hypothetical protein
MPIASAAACHRPMPWPLWGRSGAGLGDHRDAAPAQAWPGRIVIAKPFRSYLPAVNEMSAPGVTEPTLALAAGNPDPLRRAPATG